MSNGHLRPSSRGTLFNKKDEYPYSQAQVQNVKTSRVYVFGAADVAEDEVVEFEMGEIRSRKAPKVVDTKEKEPVYFEREITEGDSLQSISLQYGCAVSELKRINNFIQDQDFYARRVVKVPLKRYSFMTELIDQQKDQSKHNSDKRLNNGLMVVDERHDNASDAMDDTDNESIRDMSDPETQNLIIRTLSISDTLKSQSREAKEFLDNMDKDLSKIRQTNNRTNRRSLDEVVSMLTNQTIRPFPSKATKVDGANWGISWKSLIICLVAFAIISPVVFFIFVKYS